MKAKHIFLALVVIAFSQCMNAGKFSDIDWFKKKLQEYKYSNGSLHNFPLWNYAEFPECVRFALQAGVKGDIHTLSNAVETNNPKVVSLILENNPAIIDEYYHAKYADAVKRSERYISRTATQEAAYNLQEEVFLVLLKYDPNTEVRTPLGDSIASILKHQELLACYSKASLDGQDNNQEDRSDCQKAKRMMAALFEKKYLAN